jgi:hypothetical protein
MSNKLARANALGYTSFGVPGGVASKLLRVMLFTIEEKVFDVVNT